MTRIVWHIGLPKTGTTFLQSTLQENDAALGPLGLAFPGGEPQMFLSALDITDASGGWGREPERVRGTWARTVAQARAHDGVAVLSHELMAQATPEQIARAAAPLQGADVDLVLTVRDPARQAIAEWQEGIKHGRRKTFEQFRTTVMAADADNEHARRYRASQHLPSILERWGTVAPPERTHIVVNPPGGSDPRVLLDLFFEVLGVSADSLDLTRDGANASLGPEQIDLLRRVNIALGDRLKQPGYGAVAKRYYAQRLLAATTTSRPRLPDDLHAEMVATAEQWTDLISSGGYVVHGDLGHLKPAAPRGEPRHPDDVELATSLDVAATTTAELLLEVHRLREANHDLRHPAPPARSRIRRLAASAKRRLLG